MAIKNSMKAWNIKTNANILNLSASNSFACIITEPNSKGYSGAVSFYNQDGVRALFKATVGYFPIDAGFFSKEKENRLFINGISIDGINVNSVLEITNDVGEKNIGSFNLGEDFFPYVFNDKNGNIFVVGENTFLIKDFNLKAVYEKKYENGIISNASFFEDKYLFVSVLDKNKYENKNSETRNYLYNSAGNLVLDYFIDDKIKAVDFINDRILISSSREAYVLDLNGNVIEKFTSISEIKNTWFINKKTVLTVTANDVTVYELYK